MQTATKGIRKKHTKKKKVKGKRKRCWMFDGKLYTEAKERQIPEKGKLANLYTALPLHADSHKPGSSSTARLTVNQESHALPAPCKPWYRRLARYSLSRKTQKDIFISLSQPATGGGQPTPTGRCCSRLETATSIARRPRQPMAAHHHLSAGRQTTRIETSSCRVRAETPQR